MLMTPAIQSLSSFYTTDDHSLTERKNQKSLCLSFRVSRHSKDDGTHHFLYIYL